MRYIHFSVCTLVPSNCSSHRTIEMKRVNKEMKFSCEARHHLPRFWSWNGYIFYEDINIGLELYTNWVFLFQAKIREAPSLEGHVLLKKLRDSLEFLKGRLTGLNKEDIEKTISLVSRLCKLTHIIESVLPCLSITKCNINEIFFQICPLEDSLFTYLNIYLPKAWPHTLSRWKLWQ